MGGRVGGKKQPLFRVWEKGRFREGGGVGGFKRFTLQSFSTLDDWKGGVLALLGTDQDIFAYVACKSVLPERMGGGGVRAISSEF